MGGQIKLKSWRDDVTGHIPERQYLPHLLNPDPMRVTFPLEKATSVGHHVDVLRRVNNARPRTSTTSLWEMLLCASQQNRSDHSRRLRSCFDNVMITEMRRMLPRFILWLPHLRSAESESNVHSPRSDQAPASFSIK